MVSKSSLSFIKMKIFIISIKPFLNVSYLDNYLKESHLHHLMIYQWKIVQFLNWHLLLLWAMEPSLQQNQACWWYLSLTKFRWSPHKINKMLFRLHILPLHFFKVFSGLCLFTSSLIMFQNPFPLPISV